MNLDDLNFDKIDESIHEVESSFSTILLTAFLEYGEMSLSKEDT